MEESITLQENIPLAKCQLWELQKEFFCQQGIHAWTDNVPFYITSNPYIAYSYANIIIRFMQDYSRLDRYLIDTPFYIVELGAGSGQFSFYLLKHLLALQKTLQLKQKFIYVMTDFNKQIIEQWQQHPALQFFITEGILDFAVYDTELNQTIELLCAQKTLNPSAPSAKPLIVIANYVFDSIAHDVFKIKNGCMQECLVNLDIHPDDMEDGKPQELDAINVKFNYRPLSQLQYYTDPFANQVLNDYFQENKEGYLSFPIGAMRCINQLHTLTKGNLLLLATDKGYTNHTQEFIAKQPKIVFHGSFSFEVDFNALGRYSQHCGGEYYFPTSCQYITSTAFLFGKKFAEFPELQQALHTFFNGYSPSNLFGVYSLLKKTKKEGDLQTMLSVLNTTHWDPRLFNLCAEEILARIPHSKETALYALYRDLEQIAGNYYYLPGSANTLANIGLIYQALGDFPKALQYYQLSARYIDPTAATNFNQGVCHYNLGNYDTAVEMFSWVLEQEPENMLACGWLTNSIKQSKSLIEENIGMLK